MCQDSKGPSLSKMNKAIDSLPRSTGWLMLIAIVGLSLWFFAR
jgi:hypothetical protein